MKAFPSESPSAHNNKLGSLRLRHAETNEIVLIPTPSKDPNDPLNWYDPLRLLTDLFGL